MLYQGGYLTIKDFRNPFFTLGVPNEEIRLDLNSLLLQYAAKDPPSTPSPRPSSKTLPDSFGPPGGEPGLQTAKLPSFRIGPAQGPILHKC